MPDDVLHNFEKLQSEVQFDFKEELTLQQIKKDLPTTVVHLKIRNLYEMIDGELPNKPLTPEATPPRLSKKSRRRSFWCSIKKIFFN